MTAFCPAVVKLCAIRATRLDSLGNPEAGPNNVYVSNNSIMLTIKPEIEAGTSKTMVGGCDCIIADYRGYDKLKRFNLELDQGLYEPALQELLLGASAILDGSDPIGIWYPDQLTCSQPTQPNVCFEAWQDLWEDDHAASSPYQYLHYLFPSSFWQIGDSTAQNDFNMPKMTAFTRTNPNWGEGIFGDLPEACPGTAGYFFEDTIPDAACNWQTQAIT